MKGLLIMIAGVTLLAGGIGCSVVKQSTSGGSTHEPSGEMIETPDGLMTVEEWNKSLSAE
jgi:hypothetical protein